MKLFTKAQYAQLLANGREQAPLRGTGAERDFWPVVKLVSPGIGATFLLTEIDPEKPDVAFGLCYFGFGQPRLDFVVLSHMVRRVYGGSVRRHRWFKAKKPLSAYAEEAYLRHRIIA